MAQVYGKQVAGYRYDILYRIINCLDCSYPQLGKQKNLKLATMYYSASPINKQIRHCIHLLQKKKPNLSLEQIAVELQYIFGKNVITNQRDHTFRSQ